MPCCTRPSAGLFALVAAVASVAVPAAAVLDRTGTNPNMKLVLHIANPPASLAPH